MRKIIIALGITALGLVGFASSAQAAPSVNANKATCFTDNSDSTCTQKGQTFTVVADAGEWGGVYVESQSLAGHTVKNLDLRFTYSGDVSGGSPRFSIPVVGGGYAFVDALRCDANHDGVVNIQEPGCIIDGAGGDAVVAAGYTFIITDQPGTVTLSGISLGRTPPGKVA